jgi:hypothetical protein
MSCKDLFARIIPGSKAAFDLVLTKKGGSPFDLTLYTSGNLVFLNTAGVRTVVPLVFPVPVPGSGIIPTEITSTLTADADAKWLNADLELSKGADPEIYPLENKFEIVARKAPVITP